MLSHYVCAMARAEKACDVKKTLHCSEAERRVKSWKACLTGAKTDGPLLLRV